MNTKDNYHNEAKEKWGHTQAFKQSEERVKKLGKEGLKKVIAESEKLTREIAEAMNSGETPESGKVQKLIAKHYEGLKAFYEPNLTMYKGLAKMYIEDERFKKNYEKVAKGLAQFIHDGIIEFVRNNL